MNINIFRKRNSFKKKSMEIDVDFYWRVILYATFLLILLGGAFGFYLFSQVDKATTSSLDSTASQVGRVKKERIEKVLKYFSEKEDKSKNIWNSPSPIVDPSR